MIIVIDSKGEEQSWSWLTEKYGKLDCLPSYAPNYFELTKVVETEGNQVLKVHVKDMDGAPMSVMVVLTYPSLGEPSTDLADLTVGDPAVNQWSLRGLAAFTDSSTGSYDFGLGADSYITDPAKGGPYNVWIYHNQYGSDCLSCIGWLPWSNHVGPCDLTFELSGSDYEDPDVDEVSYDALIIVDAINKLTAAIDRIRVEGIRTGQV
jgi:hypothetical protein